MVGWSVDDVGGTSTEKGAKSFGIRNSNRPPTGAVDYDFPDIFAVPPEEYFQVTMTKFPEVCIFILILQNNIRRFKHFT